MILRPYQDLMITGVRGEFKKGIRKTCLVAPCGAGKTVIMANLALKTSLKGKRVLFMVHRQELVEQSSRTMGELGIKHGIIAPSFELTQDLIQIGMVMSVARRIGRLAPPDIIIIDEAHHSTANTWKKILEAYPKAWVIGLTATPTRMDGSGLGDIFNSLIIGPSVKQLIEWGNLAPFKYFAPPVKVDTSQLRVRYGDYVKNEVTTLMDDRMVIGDAVKHYQKLAEGKKAVCYCASRQHSKHTAEIFTQNGIKAVHIDGDTPKEERRKIIEAFRLGEIRILCNVDLISEGFDVPSMEAVILLRPTKSLTLHIQQSMRAMRPDAQNPEKRALIIDHVGNVYQHGLPDEDREWDLVSSDKKEKQKREFTLKVCPKCFSAHKPSKICPYCKYVYEAGSRSNLDEVDGQLTTIEELERKKEKRREVGRARNIVDLETIALERGYKLAWISKMAELKKIPLGG